MCKFGLHSISLLQSVRLSVLKSVKHLVRQICCYRGLTGSVRAAANHGLIEDTLMAEQGMFNEDIDMSEGIRATC
jgi:hypothetical protein